MSTRDRLVTEAALLLDGGGDAAVTLRAVAHAVGVSHNAPYRHFKDRNALLAAIAERDFTSMTAAFERARENDEAPAERLRQALTAFIEYGRDFPARYRLLFSDPDIGAAEGPLEVAALETFAAFAALIADCQAAGDLPKAPTRELAALVYAAVHGLIDLKAGGRMREQKGLSTVELGVTTLLSLLRTAASQQTQSEAD